MPTLEASSYVLQAIESYLAIRVTRGEADAKALHAQLLPLLSSPSQERARDLAKSRVFNDVLVSMAGAGAFDAEAESTMKARNGWNGRFSDIDQERNMVVQRLMEVYHGMPATHYPQDYAEKQRQALTKVDAAAENLIARLDQVGGLERATIQRAAHQLRLAVATATGDSSKMEASSQALESLNAGGDVSPHSSPEHSHNGALDPLIASGWSLADERTKDFIPTAVYMRELGGPGTPYAVYELTISREGERGWWPFHGSKAMPMQATAQAAADVLIAWWNEIPDGHKLRAKPNKELPEPKFSLTIRPSNDGPALG